MQRFFVLAALIAVFVAQVNLHSRDVISEFGSAHFRLRPLTFAASGLVAFDVMVGINFGILHGIVPLVIVIGSISIGRPVSRSPQASRFRPTVTTMSNSEILRIDVHLSSFAPSAALFAAVFTCFVPIFPDSPASAFSNFSTARTSSRPKLLVELMDSLDELWRSNRGLVFGFGSGFCISFGFAVRFGVGFAVWASSSDSDLKTGHSLLVPIRLLALDSAFKLPAWTPPLLSGFRLSFWGYLFPIFLFRPAPSS